MIRREIVEELGQSDSSKTVHIKGKECTIELKNAVTGVINGERKFLDQEPINAMINGMIKVITENHTKYNPIPEKITITHKSMYNEQGTDNEKDVLHESKVTGNYDSKKENKIGNEVDCIVECIVPKFSYEQVCFNKNAREQLHTVITAIKNRDKLCKELGLSESIALDRTMIVNLYGKPGTGKTMAAHAIAHLLNKKLCMINYAELESKYVGETPKNIRKVFQIAEAEDAILVFDEADSFLGKRLTAVTQSADYGVNITRSVLLMELEKFKGIVIFTTNLYDNYDVAFKRRILASIPFDLPDVDARGELWKLYLNDKIPRNNVKYETLVYRYDNVSGADIKDIVFYAAVHALEKEKQSVDMYDFDYAFSLVMSRYEERSTFTEIEKKEEIISEEQYRKETGDKVCR